MDFKISICKISLIGPFNNVTSLYHKPIKFGLFSSSVYYNNLSAGEMLLRARN